MSPANPWSIPVTHDTATRDRLAYWQGLRQAVRDTIDGGLAARVRSLAPAHPKTLEKTPWVRRIAQQAPAPHADRPRPEDGSWVHATDLRSLSQWHFGA